MSAPAIVGDADFTAFQEKLATVVTNARARGVVVGHKESGKCCCPLGAHPHSLSDYPSSPAARAGGWEEVPEDHLGEFINGFGRTPFRPSSPYEQLGARYRELYP